MARLLRNQDYLRQIQESNILQIIEEDDTIRHYVEQAAQSEMISYLAQRYITSKIFTDTSEFDIDATYYGKNLVEYTAAEYAVNVAYVVDDRVAYKGKLYKNILGCTGVVPTFATNWTYICEDKSLYYAKTNESEYSHSTTYAIGDDVWYNDVVYTCIAESLAHLPTDTGYWTAGATYSFDGFYPENTTYWTKGDNRNQLIVTYLIDITLYHLHSRINPRNIPELRYVRYDGGNALQTGGAIGWLKKVSSGDVTAELPVIIPEQGVSIRYGSVTKNTNTY
jgi:hypothetical protein